MRDFLWRLVISFVVSLFLGPLLVFLFGGPAIIFLTIIGAAGHIYVGSILVMTIVLTMLWSLLDLRAQRRAESEG